ncbi:interference hedgehog-like [Homarus americanus]|uniref:interference hedgehog-like n=1 Tax=Homarus americanus TaxID=6706 RepID=UPI001C466D3E|nr:interference hedgehog-like [Homarus americanus]
MCYCSSQRTTVPPPLHALSLLLVVVMGATTAAEFGIGFKQWPATEIYAVRGGQVRLPCATNVTAEKISWQYNHHFLLAPAVADDDDDDEEEEEEEEEEEHHRSLPFDVQQTEDGSVLVVNLNPREAEYQNQLGLYQCVAWFGAIALTSLPGRLVAAVLEPYPKGGAPLVELEVVEGGSARVECGAPTSVPEATITFFKDDQRLDVSQSTAYHLTPHGDLLIHDVGVWAAGEYSCIAHNTLLEEKTALNTRTILKVVPRSDQTPAAQPSFITLRTIYTGHTGTNLTLLCLVNGHPEPVVRWSKYGGTLPSRSSQQENGSLLISQLAVEDEGTYLCQANNGVGSEVTLDVAVDVLEVPSITQSPDSQDVEEGKGVSLVCKATGHPQPKIMWVFNGGLVRNDGNILITENGLTIDVVAKEHAGIFQCFAHNPEGTVQSVAMISVVPKTVTAGPGATILNNNYVPSETNDNQRWRNGQRRDGGGGNGGKVGGNGGERRGHDRSGVPGQGGTSRRNEEKVEEPVVTEKKKGKKGFMVPPSKPRMTKVSDESVMVTWDGPETSGLPILFYKIQFKLVRSRGNRGSRWMTVDDDIPSHVHSYEVTGLQTGRTYRFRIAAVYANNDNKLGPNSQRFLLEKDLIMQRPAYPPTITTLIPQGSTAVKLEWQYDPSPGVPVDGFYVNYREATKAGDYTKLTILGAAERSIVISHLQANVSYDFKIQCFNLAGASDFSAVFKKNVAGSPPVTTEAPAVVNDIVPIVKNDDLTLSNVHLYIILGAVLGLLLLIVIVSATVYTCRNKHSEDDTRSTKYEDTSLHIHRETSTYILPHQRNNGQSPNGYLPHQGIDVTQGDDDKAAIESAVVENNNHNAQERCYTPSTRRRAPGDGSVDADAKTQVQPRHSSESCEGNVRSCGDKDPTTRDLALK